MIISKLLAKSNRLSLLKVKTCRQISKQIKTEFMEFSIDIPIKNDLDYFESLIMYEGLKNKQTLETNFENERTDLLDLWDNLSYKERNALILLKVQTHIDNCKYFYDVNHNKIIIPFFDELLNALYIHELSIFELEQYFNLYRDFKDKCVHRHYFGLYPYTNGFIPIDLILREEDHVYFYYEPTRSLYCLDKDHNLIKYPLIKTLIMDDQVQTELLELAQSLSLNHPLEIIDLLVNSHLIADKTKKSLKKHRLKIK